MQRELALDLGGEGDQARVVRTRADFAEPDVVALHEQLDAEQAAAAQRGGDLAGDVLGPGQGGGAHRLRLPALDIVSLHLPVADRGAEVGLDLARRADGADGQQGDLEVEVDAALDDDQRRLHATSGEGVIPGRADVGRRLDIGLALSRRAHHRLDEAGVADRRRAGLQRLAAARERIGAGRQAEVLGGQPADALAVHGQLGGAGGRDADGVAGRFHLGQHLGGDGLDLRHDQVRALQRDDGLQRRRVGHGHDVAAVRHLHGRGVGVAVDADHLDPQPLQRDGHFLAELAAAQQHHAGGVGGERGAEFHRFIRARWGDRLRCPLGHLNLSPMLPQPSFAFAASTTASAVMPNSL